MARSMPWVIGVADLERTAAFLEWAPVGVFAPRNSFKMGWVDAPSDAAKMIPFQAIGCFSNKEGVGLSRTGRASISARPVPERSVAASKKAASPQPTGLRLVDVFPEALFRTLRLAKEDPFGHAANPIPSFAGAIVAPTEV